MKKTAVLFVLLGMLGGCVNKPEDAGVTPEPTQQTAAEPTPVPLIFQDIEKERVGRRGVGFIDIPAGWCDGSGNAKAADNNLLYLDDYSDFTYIVSMKSDTLKQQRTDKTLDVSAEELMDRKVEELLKKYGDNVIDYHHVKDTIAEMETEKCWFSVGDDTVHYCWIFRDPSKIIHYIEVRTKTAEATSHAPELAEMVISSFALNK